MVAVPRFAIAAPSSGQGKTTVAVGLMAAFRRAGATVGAAKVGPDYIDPGYHALATGRRSYNLDPWLHGEQLVPALLARAAQAQPAPTMSPRADLTIVEGVMGLFDGQLGREGWSSTAHVAALTKTPVVLVIDIRGAARTVAAVAQGLATFDDNVHVAGVIINKAGSARHVAEVTSALEKAGMCVFGALPRDDNVTAPSRHLGLVPVDERDDAESALNQLADHVASGINLDALRDLANTASPLGVTPWTPDITHTTHRPRIAIAGGRAFTFRYADIDDTIRAAGCDIAIFDPATDQTLPAGTCGIYLGGGFPEMHTTDLAANTVLLADIRRAIDRGMPVVAECAGLLYLSNQLDDVPMVGAVPAQSAMHASLTLGYREATSPTDTLLTTAGDAVRGHEFHRTVTTPRAYDTDHDTNSAAWMMGDELEGFSLDPATTGRPTVHASYLHISWAGHPNVAQRFVTAADTFAATPPAGNAHELDYHGDDVMRHHPDALNFAVNVRLPHPPPWLAEKLTDPSTWGEYPDAAPAEHAIAAAHRVPPECVLATAGAAEAFTLIARATTATQPTVVHPQFTEPERALRAVGHTPHRVTLTEPFTLTPAQIPPTADLVFVGNPTNPTGVLHPAGTLNRLRQPGRLVVVDEAFMDTAARTPHDTSVEPETLITATTNPADYRGLLIIRSLTKTWGIAGLRAGYVIGDPEHIAALRDHQPDWSVSAPAIAAIIHTATDRAQDDVRAAREQTARDRAYLVDQLTQRGYRLIDSAAAFVLVRAGHGTFDALLLQSIAVRRCDTFPGLDGSWIRVAVRSQSFTDQLVAALDRIGAP